MAITWHRLEAGPHEPVLGDDLVQRVGLREELGLAGRHDDLAGDRQAGEARDGGRRHGLNSGSEEQASSGVDASCSWRKCNHYERSIRQRPAATACQNDHSIRCHYALLYRTMSNSERQVMPSGRKRSKACDIMRSE